MKHIHALNSGLTETRNILTYGIGNLAWRRYNCPDHLKRTQMTPLITALVKPEDNSEIAYFLPTFQKQLGVLGGSNVPTLRKLGDGRLNFWILQAVVPLDLQ